MLIKLFKITGLLCFSISLLACNKTFFSPEPQSLRGYRHFEEKRDSPLSKGEKQETFLSLQEKALFSPDGKFFAEIQEEQIILWEVSSEGKLENKKNLRGHSQDVTTFLFSPQSNLLASVSPRGNIFIWNLSSGSSEQTLIGDSKIVQEMVFSANGNFLASIEQADISQREPGKIVLWNVSSGKKMSSFSGFSPIFFSPNSSHFFYRDEKGMVKRAILP